MARSVDEQRPASAAAPSDGVAPQAAVPPRRGLARLRAPLGVATALAIAFVWGGLAYRELGPKAAALGGARALSVSEPGSLVLGSEAPPGWMGAFASSFCGGDADAMSPRMGPPLSGQVEAIRSALAPPDWDCRSIGYIGGGTNPKGTFYVFVMEDSRSAQQWWVFTVVNDAVVSIE